MQPFNLRDWLAEGKPGRRLNPRDACSLIIPTRRLRPSAAGADSPAAPVGAPKCRGGLRPLAGAAVCSHPAVRMVIAAVHGLPEAACCQPAAAHSNCLSG